MKKAIATIETEIGTMTIYYNGENEEITAETENVIEEIGYCPESIEDAREAVYEMYNYYVWELNLFEEE